MPGINCISKRSLWRRWEAGKLPAMVQPTDDESNDKEEGREEKTRQDLGTAQVHKRKGERGTFDPRVNHFSDQMNEATTNQNRTKELLGAGVDYEKSMSSVLNMLHLRCLK